MPIPPQDEARPTSQTARLLVIVALVALAILAFRDLIRPNIFPKRFHEVVPGQLYRSGKLTPAALTSVVRAHGIKTIVDLGAWPEGSRADTREARTAAALGVDRIRLPNVEGDSTGDVNTYVQALRIVNDPTRRPVLVHCGAGTERTGCVVALYRMFEEGWGFDKAYDEAVRAGHSPGRNPKLRQTLENWSEPIRDALVTGGKVEMPAPDAPGRGG
ncbi:MAG: tyrosine-protein phosphatase [Phycisphaerales bacterium]|nr:tyrosine-protein phosphatase [Phycisphaerales bacterium]